MSIALLLAACSHAEPPATRQPEPVKAAKRKPRGWKAYPKHRVRDVAGLAAADAPLVDEQGRELALSSLWTSSYVVLVFYRGHW